MVTPITKAQSKQINKLARERCANWVGGNCLLLDDGESQPCVQLFSNSGIYCNYFERSVLPADKALYNEIVGKNNGNCHQCGKAFHKTTAHHKYCAMCAKRRHRAQKTLSEQKRRLRSL